MLRATRIVLLMRHPFLHIHMRVLTIPQGPCSSSLKAVVVGILPCAAIPTNPIRKGTGSSINWRGPLALVQRCLATAPSIHTKSLGPSPVLQNVTGGYTNPSSIIPSYVSESVRDFGLPEYPALLRTSNHSSIAVSLSWLQPGPRFPIAEGALRTQICRPWCCCVLEFVLNERVH